MSTEREVSAWAKLSNNNKTKPLQRSFSVAFLDLIKSGIDTNVIKLMGRWRSDEMMRYLHVTAQALTHNHAHTMLAGGNYDLLAPALAPASS